MLHFSPPTTPLRTLHTPAVFAAGDSTSKGRCSEVALTSDPVLRDFPVPAVAVVPPRESEKKRQGCRASCSWEDHPQTTILTMAQCPIWLYEFGIIWDA